MSSSGYGSECVGGACAFGTCSGAPPCGGCCKCLGGCELLRDEGSESVASALAGELRIGAVSVSVGEVADSFAVPVRVGCGLATGGVVVGSDGVARRSGASVPGNGPDPDVLLCVCGHNVLAHRSGSGGRGCVGVGWPLYNPGPGMGPRLTAQVPVRLCSCSLHYVDALLAGTGMAELNHRNYRNTSLPDGSGHMNHSWSGHDRGER